MFKTVSDSDGIHRVDSSVDKTATLSKLSSEGAAGFGNESLSKPWICDHLGGDDFNKGCNPIDDSVLDHIHLGLTYCGEQPVLFFSSCFES